MAATPVMNPIAEPELSTSGEAVIAEEVCEKTGHDYTNTTLMFARDKHGNAITGAGYDVAAKFQVWVCRRCGGTIELKVLPKLEVRFAKNPRP